MRNFNTLDDTMDDEIDTTTGLPRDSRYPAPANNGSAAVPPDDDIDPVTDEPVHKPSPIAALAAPNVSPIANAVSPDEQKALSIKDYLTNKFAKEEKDLKDAQANSQRNNTIANIGSGLETLARSNSMAHGGQGVDQSFYQGISQQGQQGVQNAQQNRSNAIQKFLQNFEMNRQMTQDQMTKGTYETQQKAAQIKAAMDDGSSPYSKQMLASARSLFKDDPKAISALQDGMSANQVGQITKTLQENAKIAKQGQETINIHNLDAEGNHTVTPNLKIPGKTYQGSTSPIKDETQDAGDKAYAKEQELFTTSGYQKALNSIQDMEAMITKLTAKPKGGAEFLGRFPDSMNTNEDIQNKTDAQSLIIDTLKETFPGHLSDDERRAQAGRVFIARDSNANNAARMKVFLENAKKNLEAKKGKSDYFIKNKRSTKGFVPETPGAGPQYEQDVLDYAKKHGVSNEEAQKYKDSFNQKQSPIP